MQAPAGKRELLDIDYLLFLNMSSYNMVMLRFLIP